MNIPIYRAKKIYSDEYVEGDLISSYRAMTVIKNQNLEEYEIDESALTMSIDDGKNFYSISFVTRAIEDHIEATEIKQ